MCIEMGNFFSLGSLSCIGVAEKFPASFQGQWQALKGTWVLLGWACCHHTFEVAWWYICLFNTEVVLTADLAWGKRCWILAYREEMSSPVEFWLRVLSCDVGILAHQGVTFFLRVVFLWSSGNWVLGYNVYLLHETDLSKPEHQTGKWGVLGWIRQLSESWAVCWNKLIIQSFQTPFSLGKLLGGLWLVSLWH